MGKLLLGNVPDVWIDELNKRAEAQGVPRASIIKAILYDALQGTETAQTGTN